MRSKLHQVNQNANIAVNESHRNRRKRRIVKSPGHLKTPVFLLSPKINTRGGGGGGGGGGGVGEGLYIKWCIFKKC